MAGVSGRSAGWLNWGVYLRVWGSEEAGGHGAVLVLSLLALEPQDLRLEGVALEGTLMCRSGAEAPMFSG